MCVCIPGEHLRAGWGVVRLAPWHLAGVFLESSRAEELAALLGPTYVVKYGEHAIGSSEFTFTEAANAPQ